MSQPRFRPNVTVACVVEARGRYLVVEERIDGRIRYNQPAGHLEAGESLVNAAQRELWEETGLELAPEGLIRIHQWRSANGVEFLRFAFGFRLPAPLDPAPRDPQILAAHWWTPNELAARHHQLRTPLVLQAIDDFQARPLLPLDLLESCF